VSCAIDLIPIIETAHGLSQIDAILAVGTRVKRIAFGAGDCTLDVTEMKHQLAAVHRMI
jgi:citrate lyase subunit beta/citryl-CoA lyase